MTLSRRIIVKCPWNHTLVLVQAENYICSMMYLGCDIELSVFYQMKKMHTISHEAMRIKVSIFLKRSISNAANRVTQ